MIVAIPSKGRAGKVKSQAVIPSARVYVPELEVEAYERLGAENVVAVPDSIRGITRTRNWILDHESDPWIVFVDDDVKKAGWCELNAFNTTRHKLTPGQWLAEFARLFELTEDLQYRIWGLATQDATRSIYPYRPFLWHSYVTASCMGVRNDTGVRFDESFDVKEDYELCLRCIKEDGGVVAARYLFWENSHWNDAAGCKDYRTGELERDCIERLIVLYPGLIRRVTRGGSSYSIRLDF